MKEGARGEVQSRIGRGQTEGIQGEGGMKEWRNGEMEREGDAHLDSLLLLPPLGALGSTWPRFHIRNTSLEMTS